MTVLIIGSILALLGGAAALYHMHRDPAGAAEARAGAYWWMAWPM
jgi:hypothetical protein